MNALVLFYEEKLNSDQKILTVDTLSGVHDHENVNVVTSGNAYEINCYLFKHDLEVSNPEFLKKELNELRKKTKLLNGIDCAIGEEDIIALREVLGSIINSKEYNLIVSSYLTLQIESDNDSSGLDGRSALVRKARAVIAKAEKS